MIDTPLLEYVATAILFVIFAFRIWEKSYSTALFGVSLSFAICIGKYVSMEWAVLLLIISLFAAMVRAILHRKVDVMIRGRTA